MESDSPAQPDAPAEPAVSRRSPNWAAPIIYFLLLTGAGMHRGEIWGYLWQSIYGVFVLIGGYSSFAPSEVRKELERNPGMTRGEHLLLNAVPYVLFPAIGWLLVIPLEWNAGAVVPVVPWALLLVIALVAR